MIKEKNMRKRRSKFDPYREKITEWCLAGVPVRKMCEFLEEETDEFYDEQAIHAYIRSHNLRTRPWKDVYEARNQCDQCEFCHEYTNTNNSKGRICSKSWRTIQRCVIHSPIWCEK